MEGDHPHIRNSVSAGCVLALEMRSTPVPVPHKHTSHCLVFQQRTENG